MSYKALMDEIRFDKKWNPDRQDLPASAIRAVLCITQAAGLVRLTRHGFSITEVDREVQRRIEPETRTRRPQVCAIRSISGSGRRPEAPLQSFDRTDLRELRERALTPVQQ
jgi:hypothetical protein